MATIALAGGGTGGHVYPALAIGDVLTARGHTVLYFGDPGRLEARVAPERGYAFREVRALQYPRGGLLGKLRFGWGLLRSSWAARGQLAADGVDVVLGVGGYISAPPVLGAWLSGRGRAVHEANVVPGLANKLCARVAQQVLLTYAATETRLTTSAPMHVVGVPVNPRVLQGDRRAARQRYGLALDKPVICFVGGSLGAQRLNELAMAVALNPERGASVLHITGPRYYDAVVGALGALPPDVCLVDYETRMGDAYAAADLVVARAGSSTLAELAAVGRASLLIPSPNVTENHQELNARGLEEVGAAEVLVEQDWDESAAVARVLALAGDAERLARMAGAARSQARLDAAERAADVVESLIR